MQPAFQYNFSLQNMQIQTRTHWRFSLTMKKDKNKNLNTVCSSKANIEVIIRTTTVKIPNFSTISHAYPYMLIRNITLKDKNRELEVYVYR